MRSSDYFIGILGAGLSLSVFLPKNSILQEIHGDKVNTLLTLMSALSGHVTYSDLIKNQNRLRRQCRALVCPCSLNEHSFTQGA